MNLNHLLGTVLTGRVVKCSSSKGLVSIDSSIDSPNSMPMRGRSKKKAYLNSEEIARLVIALRTQSYRDLLDKELTFILTKNYRGYCAKGCRLVTVTEIENSDSDGTAIEGIDLEYSVSLEVVGDYEWLCGPSLDVITHHHQFYSVMKSRVAWSSDYNDVSCQGIATIYMNEMSKYNQCMLHRLWEMHLGLGVNTSQIESLKSSALRLFNLHDDRRVTVDKLAIVIQKIYWSQEDLFVDVSRQSSSSSSSADPAPYSCKQKLLCDVVLMDLLDYINTSVLHEDTSSTSSDRGADGFDPLSERKLDRYMFYKVAWVMHRLYGLHKRTVSLLNPRRRSSSSSNSSSTSIVIDATMSYQLLPPLWLEILAIDLLYKSGLPFALNFYLERTSSIDDSHAPNSSSSAAAAVIPCDEVQTGPHALRMALSSPDERKLAVLLQRVAAEQWQEYDGLCAAAIKTQSRRSYTTSHVAPAAESSVTSQQLLPNDGVEQDVAADRAFVLKRKRLQSEVCFICMEDNCKHAPTVSLLCCGQPTHVSCMARWYSTKSHSVDKTCPNCRQVLQEPTHTQPVIVAADTGTPSLSELMMLRMSRSGAALGRTPSGTC